MRIPFVLRMTPALVPALVPALLALLLLAPPAPALADTGDLVLSKCTVCHSPSRICNHLGGSHPWWDDTVARMVNHGAALQAPQIAKVSSWLANQEPGAEPLCTVDAAFERPLIVSLGMGLHPLLMAGLIALGFYVLLLGLKRLRSKHFGAQVPFAWKRHVLLGLVVLVGMLLGMLGGMGTMFVVTGTVNGTGWHFANAMYMLPLILFGIASGLWMDRNKAPRTALPLIHAAVNALVLLLALCQAATGVGIYLHVAW